MKWNKTIQRAGDGVFFVILPKSFLDMYEWKQGDEVVVETQSDGSLNIMKAKK
jgi:antitoxin component of MazEF toxin-antitoxin module